MPKCKVCKEVYTKSRPLQAVCSPICALQLAQIKREKTERSAYRAAKDKIKSRGEWAREAQAAVNAWVRWRDKDLGCISCGKPASWNGQWHAGHYLSRGAHPELAYEADRHNLTKQCAQCNMWLSGNQAKMRQGLIERHGQHVIDWLEGPHEPKKYTIDDLRQIRDDYRMRLRQAKRCPQE